jgi:hypothetical protein
MVQNLKEIKGLLPYQQKKPVICHKTTRKIAFKINARLLNPLMVNGLTLNRPAHATGDKNVKTYGFRRVPVRRIPVSVSLL